MKLRRLASAGELLRANSRYPWYALARITSTLGTTDSELGRESIDMGVKSAIFGARILLM